MSNIFELIEQNKQSEAIKLLKRETYLTHVSNDNNIFPLYCATLKGYITLVECLLKEGAEIDQENGKNGLTALYAAAEKGFDKISIHSD